MISSYFSGKIGLDFGHDPCWSWFCLNSVLKEKVLKVLLTFSQNYSIIKHKVIELTIKKSQDIKL